MLCNVVKAFLFWFSFFVQALREVIGLVSWLVMILLVVVLLNRRIEVKQKE